MLLRIYTWVTTLLLTATCFLFYKYEFALNLLKFLQLLDIVGNIIALVITLVVTFGAVVISSEKKEEINFGKMSKFMKWNLHKVIYLFSVLTAAVILSGLGSFVFAFFAFLNLVAPFLLLQWWKGLFKEADKYNEEFRKTQKIQKEEESTKEEFPSEI